MRRGRLISVFRELEEALYIISYVLLLGIVLDKYKLRHIKLLKYEEIRWALIKSMLDEFPELRLKCLKYVRETEKRELKALMKKHLPEKIFKRILILYGEEDC